MYIAPAGRVKAFGAIRPDRLPQNPDFRKSPSRPITRPLLLCRRGHGALAVMGGRVGIHNRSPQGDDAAATFTIDFGYKR